MFYVLDWCAAYTGLRCVALDQCVVCCMDWCDVICDVTCCMLRTSCMYWTDVLYMYILHWCVICTGLVCCCIYWTGVMYITGLHVALPRPL